MQQPMAVAMPTIRMDKAQGSKWIGQGWKLVKLDMVMFVIHAALFLLVSGAIPLILQGPMMLGLQYAMMRRMLVGKTEIGDVFKDSTTLCRRWWRGFWFRSLGALDLRCV